LGLQGPGDRCLEPVYGVHYLKSAAKAVGVPFCYDAGAERQSWLLNLLTSWMGDEGWIKRNYAEYRRFVYLSDAVWLTGKVVKKYKDKDGEPVVDIETTAVNQRVKIPCRARRPLHCLPVPKGHRPWTTGCRKRNSVAPASRPSYNIDEKMKKDKYHEYSGL